MAKWCTFATRTKPGESDSAAVTVPTCPSSRGRLLVKRYTQLPASVGANRMISLRSSKNACTKYVLKRGERNSARSSARSGFSADANSNVRSQALQARTVAQPAGWDAGCANAALDANRKMRIARIEAAPSSDTISRGALDARERLRDRALKSKPIGDGLFPLHKKRLLRLAVIPPTAGGEVLIRGGYYQNRQIRRQLSINRPRSARVEVAGD